MLSKVKKFVKLSSKEKKLFFEAYVTLGVMRLAILTVSFKRLTNSLNHEAEKKELKKLSDADMKTAQQVGKSIIRASLYTPWKSNCLAQSLTAHKMLKKRGVAGVFYLGTMKDKESAQMKAHSWSQCGENIITGKPGHEKFTVLSVFRWGRE